MCGRGRALELGIAVRKQLGLWFMVYVAVIYLYYSNFNSKVALETKDTKATGSSYQATFSSIL